MRPSASLLTVAALATAGLIAAAGTSHAAPTASTPQPSTSAVSMADTARATAADNSDLTGSIVYIRNHNVWVMRGDGTGKFQVTTDGTAGTPWRVPSMSDAGIIAAIKGTTVTFMRQNGTRTRSIQIPYGYLFGEPGNTNSNTLGAEISPDGSKLAYHQVKITTSGGVRSEYATSVTDVAALSNFSTYGLAIGKNPTWVSNNRVLLYDTGFELANLGQLTDAPRWFFSTDVSPEWYASTRDVDLAADRTLMAVADGTLVAFLHVTGNPLTSIPLAPTASNCLLTADAGTDLDNVAIDPSGDAVAIGENENGAESISVVRGLKSMVGGACPLTSVVIEKTGSAPHWSPAPLNTSGGGGGTGSTFSVVAAPKVTGTAKVGRTLTATKGTWNPAPTTTNYQWLRSGKAITGATKSTYKLTATDRGKRIAVKVTARKSGYATRSATSRFVTVKPGTFTVKAAPKISGTPRAGQTLRTTTGTWSPTPTTTRYQWLRSGKTIKGATKSSYKLTRTDRGTKITAKVTARKSGYTTRSATSKAVTVRR